MIEKLTERGIGYDDIETFVALLDSMAEWVNVPAKAIVRAVAGDADDDIVVACAVVGAADFLVTYDPHFESMGGSYRGVKIVKALPFLWTIRGDQPPGKGVGGS